MRKQTKYILALLLGGAMTFSVVAGVSPASGPNEIPRKDRLVFPSDRTEAEHLTATAKLIYDCLVQLSEKSSETDTQYYEDGLWHFSKEQGAYERMAGPARAAATLWNWQRHALESKVLPAALEAQATTERQEWLHRIAVDTFNRLIKDYQHPEGYFVEVGTPATYFFAVELVSSYLQLKVSLDEQTRSLWLSTLQSECDHMVSRGDLPNLKKGEAHWYTNGNIELGKAELLYKMWQATENPEYKDLFEIQWNHTVAPTLERWKEFGLRYDHEPTKEDGSDGSGYLCESGGSTPGYDGSYTLVQFASASALYADSHDPRVLRLTNLLLNTVLAHVDQKTWVYDATKGTRKNYKGMFTTGGLALAVYDAGRTDVAPLVPLQFEKAVKPQYTAACKENWNHPSFYLGMGTELALMLEPYIPEPVKN